MTLSVILVALGVTGCSRSSPTTIVPGPVGSTAPTTDPSMQQSPIERAAALCARTGTTVLGAVSSDGLVEASGLIASRAHAGVFWSHNDGGADPGVFGVGADGFDLGVHALAVADVTDIEDIAMGRADGVDHLYLADIGDNGARRDSIRIYRFAEPDPAVIAPIADFEVLEFVYPDRPHNAETLLVDESAGRLVIVTKEQAPDADGLPDDFGTTEISLVFEGPIDGHGAEPIELTQTGEIDTPSLEQRASGSTPHPASLLGFGGVPTGGDVSPDGELVVLRTYEAVWVWPRTADESVAQAFGNEPCQVASVTERQGEAVTFSGDGLVTLGEGANQPLNRLGE